MRYVNPRDYALAIRRVYAEAETRIIAKVARRLARGIEEPGWAEQKQAELRLLNAEIAAEIRRLERLDIEGGLQDAYISGVRQGAEELSGAGIARVSAALRDADQLAVRAIVREAVAAVGSTHVQILRTTQDVYRDVIWQATTQSLTGVTTRREAAQIALSRFADRGITGFTDARGRKWDLASYTEMATRTAAHNAQLQGHANRLIAYGRDLVRVDSHGDCCELCRPWEGRVLSLSGTHPRYPSLADAMSEGLGHPNCLHHWTLYVPGMPVPQTQSYKPELYTARERQRANERQIRHWKNRKAAAITEAERSKATAKVREWQRTQREHLRRYGDWLRRDYGRESIRRAR